MTSVYLTLLSVGMQRKVHRKLDSFVHDTQTCPLALLPLTALSQTKDLGFGAAKVWLRTKGPPCLKIVFFHAEPSSCWR